MKRKLLVGITLTLFIVTTLFIAFPVKSQWAGTIKIGAVGPMPWIQGKGIAEGIKLAAKQINAAGGILGPNGYKIEVVSADTLRGMPDPTAATGTAAGMELVSAGVDYIIGGFRTEATYGVREVAMDSVADTDKPIFIIAGASEDWLIDCGGGSWTLLPDGTPYQLPSCGSCVRCNYNRYRFTFRYTPMNSTTLFSDIASYLAWVMAAKVMPIFTEYASPLKIAVISEDLSWTDVIHAYLTSETFWNEPDPFVGMMAYGNVSVVYQARVGPVETDVSSELLAAEAAGAKIIIESLSGPVGRTMAIQMHDLAIPALLSGIDVPGQEDPLHWTATGGGCEYESFLASTGTRAPITPQMVEMWDAYTEEYGHSPIYNSYGAYDGVLEIKELIEEYGAWSTSAKERVPMIEKTYTLKGGAPLYGTRMMGSHKYTGPHPMATTEYDDYTFTNATDTYNYLQVNPTMMGTLHELYNSPYEASPYWVYNPAEEALMWGRAFCTQWQKHPVTGEGRMEIFYPFNGPYSKKFKIPPEVYSHADTDIAKQLGPYLLAMPSGAVDDKDMDVATLVWLSKPGDAAWIAGGEFYGLVADQDGNNFINIADVSAVAKEYGYSAIVEYGQWPLP